MSLLDGTLVAVDPGSGRLLWTFDSGSPLVSAAGAAEEAAHAGGGAAVQPCCSTAIFPGVDGALYTYKQDGELGRGLEVRLSVWTCSPWVMYMQLEMILREPVRA